MIEQINSDAADRIVGAAIRWRRTLGKTKGDPALNAEYREAAIALIDAVDVRFMK